MERLVSLQVCFHVEHYGNSFVLRSTFHWASLSANCGAGIQRRERLIKVDGKYGGTLCAETSQVQVGGVPARVRQRKDNAR